MGLIQPRWLIVQVGRTLQNLGLSGYWKFWVWKWGGGGTNISLPPTLKSGGGGMCPCLPPPPPPPPPFLRQCIVIVDNQLQSRVPWRYEPVRQWDIDTFLEASQESCIQLPWTIGGGQQEDLVCCRTFGALHLLKQFCLYATCVFFLPGTSAPTHTVYLIDKYYLWVAHTAANLVLYLSLSVKSPGSERYIRCSSAKRKDFVKVKIALFIYF